MAQYVPSSSSALCRGCRGATRTSWSVCTWVAARPPSTQPCTRRWSTATSGSATARSPISGQTTLCMGAAVYSHGVDIKRSASRRCRLSWCNPQTHARSTPAELFDDRWHTSRPVPLQTCTLSTVTRGYLSSLKSFLTIKTNSCNSS